MLRNIVRIVRPKLSWLLPADENIWLYVFFYTTIVDNYGQFKYTFADSHRQVAYSMAFWAMVRWLLPFISETGRELTPPLPT